jgi:hypothetical protein
VQISLHDVGGQTLRVGVRRGENAGPPLLLFNGIGANIELAEPFLDALNGFGAIILAATSPGHLMVPGKLTVLLKMATPRRYKDPEYMGKIAGDVYGGILRGSPELVRRHLRSARIVAEFLG